MQRRLRGKQLIKKVFNHEKLDEIPWVPFAGVHAGALMGYSATEILTDGNKLLEALLKVNKSYHPDGQPITFDLQIEAEILGCELKWSEKAPPMVSSHPLSEDENIPNYIPKKTDGRLPLILDVMKRFQEIVGDDTALFGLVCGPLTLASHLRGINLYLDLISNKFYAHKLLKYTTNIAIQIAKYYINAGMDIIAIVDPVVSQISPKTFDEFLTSQLKEIFQYIHSENCLSSFFVCGDATKNLEPMCKTGPQSIFIDENINMVDAYKIISSYHIILGGNIPLTTVMLFGTQQDTMLYVVDLLEKLGSNSGIIIAPGCDMPYDVPPENVIGAVQAIHEPELIRKSLMEYKNTSFDLEIKLPDYDQLESPLIEVFTIDSAVCAACGYTLEMAKEAKKYFGNQIELKEYKLTEKENIVRARKLEIANVPCILINGKVKYSSLIPSKDELIREVERNFPCS
ncbi:MAG: uroporphyrinogen decarboxylase [Candidatus Heimdallarchaeota archaeon]|nr:uroporphyrinogen decarboxylase [Candidatus Heimdallarchaeota archaeon]